MIYRLFTFLCTRHFALLLLLLTSSLSAKGEEFKTCQSCHNDIVQQWQASDHGKAMAQASPATVLANFDDVTVSHFSQTAHFQKQNDTFTIDFTEGTTTTRYTVKYVFGHYPLQEYLVPGNNGKLQVFPFAWDARPDTEGGQKWYPLHPDEDIQKADRLHWQQPLQNWNGMCADCHSSGLKRNFSSSTNQFDTHFSQINVSCQSCHGDMSAHGSQTKSTSPSLISKHDQKALGQWLRSNGENIAHWQGPPRDNAFMETCFGCHSLRSPLGDGIDPNSAFLDQFSPTFLTPPLYHADGQIKEEVYVYGSFLQSKMFAAGVNCLDCHNPHTMKVKVEGNGLCLQCHAPAAYQTTAHTHHPLDSAAGQCVNCHMPQTTFMGVDARRDHSFSVPHPQSSQQTGSPNACLNCHAEKTNGWADNAINQWHPVRQRPASVNEKGYMALMDGVKLTKKQVFTLISAQDLPVIKRATVITYLPQVVQALDDQEVAALITHPEPLIRLAVAQIGQLLPPTERLKSYHLLLKDKYRAIRVAAATHLVGLRLKDEAYLSALKELYQANAVNQWRGEGNLNQSLLHFQQGNNKQAVALLQQSLRIDPYFAASYINLAEIYRAQHQLEKEQAVLQQGLTLLPDNPLLHYSYGLFLIRQQQKTKAVTAFEKAAKLAPNNAQNWYLYALALDNIQRTDDALSVLKQGLQYVQDPRLIQLGLNFAQKENNRIAYRYFMQKKPR
ncbi:tetratricopeptide repeat protein [Alteromonas sp. C1M14]|uniref:tetratricopeptide repeat protein n=1 Tax=Alteromonas sp. C1M14 TaxID=2841567 RepID=UPI001C08F224|nr:tetratricopeptide repeat protein [Alteromonas sp. C1M14]MBU2977047.1 tetratricopeptide repeat protein [Alteromonas sp. C1M14]